MEEGPAAAEFSQPAGRDPRKYFDLTVLLASRGHELNKSPMLARPPWPLAIEAAESPFPTFPSQTPPPCPPLHDVQVTSTSFLWRFPGGKEVRTKPSSRSHPTSPRQHLQR